MLARLPLQRNFGNSSGDRYHRPEKQSLLFLLLMIGAAGVHLVAPRQQCCQQCQQDPVLQNQDLAAQSLICHPLQTEHPLQASPTLSVPDSTNCSWTVASPAKELFRHWNAGLTFRRKGRKRRKSRLIGRVIGRRKGRKRRKN